MHKVEVMLKVKLTLNMEEGVEVREVVDECDYGFTSQTEGVEVVDSEITKFTVIGSEAV